jgi:hypothetical protein
VGSQARFLAPEGRPPVDRIFRYERIDRFVAFLEDRLGCEIILPVANVSPKAATDLSASAMARLRPVMARDFALYDSLD